MSLTPSVESRDHHEEVKMKRKDETIKCIDNVFGVFLKNKFQRKGLCYFSIKSLQTKGFVVSEG